YGVQKSVQEVMSTYVRDNTGRFPQRPHYKPEELDHDCEAIITDFLKTLHGEVRYPIDTEDIKKLIERDAEYLDVYADLSSYGTYVEGMTQFRQGHKPRVLICTSLTDSDGMPATWFGSGQTRMFARTASEHRQPRTWRIKWESCSDPAIVRSPVISC
ncbi:MAG: hypothetical protein M3Z35_02180, partial [Nitrospirota bacterium]|nr:hypothetical protein [Nitrospirota bacterium]